MLRIAPVMMAARPSHLRQRGMSLVELMVGVTIGLFIVAGATLLVGNQLSDNRRLLAETQVQQDMRATVDIMTRQIRRAGVRKPNEGVSILAVPASAASAAGTSGSFDPQYTGVRVNAAQNTIEFDYALNPDSDTLLTDKPDLETNWGFRLNGGRIQSKIDRSGWQDLTDRNAIEVTQFRVTEVLRDSDVIPCPKLCVGGTRDCWPKSAVRTYQLVLEARAVGDAAVRRRLESVVRVRNNLPIFNAGSTTEACPA